ncbi:MAG TPA: UDP-glucose 4-epimerase, partial [Gemmatimonadaceae bacterium]|nr:UDP-glucose 4-epimerase [Gemmatimonadaceae bacterium]
VGTPVLDVARHLLAAAGTNTPIEFAPKRAGEPQHSSIAIDRARRVLQWAPRVSLADGLADTFRWFAARSASAATSRL